jgi:hypothetical protein
MLVPSLFLTIGIAAAVAPASASSAPEPVQLPSNVRITGLQGSTGLGTALEFDFDGRSFRIDTEDLNLLVMDALDCEQLATADREMTPEYFHADLVAVDPTTGNIAVGVYLGYCVLTTQSAVFIIDPQEGGGSSYYRLQVPGERDFPHEFASYPLHDLRTLAYTTDGDVQVTDSDASGRIWFRQFSPRIAGASAYYPRLEWYVERPGEE